MNDHQITEWIANLLGIFSVDWDSDFEDDGYTDYFGLAPLDEPMFFSYETPEPEAVPADIRPAG